jgi:CHAT domain-containing protein/tetratricopeptide (TPR) repeat protein
VAFSGLVCLATGRVTVAQCYRFSNYKNGASVTINIANLRAPTITFDQERVVYTYDLTGLSGNCATITASTKATNVPISETCQNTAISVELTSDPMSGTNLSLWAAACIPAAAGTTLVSVDLHAKPNPYFPSGILPNGPPRQLPPRSAWSAAFMGQLFHEPNGVIGPEGYAGDFDAIESCDDPPDSDPPVDRCPTGATASPPGPPPSAVADGCTLKLHNKVGEIVKVTAEVVASPNLQTPRADAAFAYLFTSSGGELKGLVASGPFPCCDSYGVPKPLPPFIATEADEVISGVPTTANAANARCRIALTLSQRAPVLLTAEDMEPVPKAGGASPPAGRSPLGQTPFHFRDVLLLEDRIGEVNDTNLQYFQPAMVQDEMLHLYTSSPDTTEPLEPLEPAYFQNAGWVGLLFEADRGKNQGGFEKAEKRLRSVLGMLRRIQGTETDAVAMVLDRIGEFYLEKRDTAGAYEIFSEALRVRRQTLAMLPNVQAGTGLATDSEPQTVYRLHLAELLTRLGQLDLARARWDLAAKELGEAVAISNEPANLEYLNGLYALYFESVLLESTGQWQQAEALWQDAVARRALLVTSAAYWNVLVEMSAFYARRGDFHTATTIVRRVQGGYDGVSRTPELQIPYLSNRRRTAGYGAGYGREASIAMKEILAVETWQSDGPEAAAQLVEDLLQGEGSMGHNFGAGSERAQLVAWLERRAFLHLSVLLDGTPSQERVNAAYDHLSQVKDRYLVSESEMHRVFERERDQPKPTHPQKLADLDQLAEIRRRIARLFIASAIDGEAFNGPEFVRLEILEQIVSRSLSKGYGQAPDEYFRVPQGTDLDHYTILVDFFKWRRTDRQSARLQAEEYGAFVTRRGEPLRYISLGFAASIDRDIQSLMDPGQSREIFRQVLQRLYKRLITPIEERIGAALGAAEGVRKLFIAPDGMLALAPFAGFIDDDGRYLLERATVSYLNTTRDLRKAEGAREPSTAAVIVANPDFDLAPGGGTAPFRLPGDQFTPRRNFEVEAQEVAKRLGVNRDQIVTREMARANHVKLMNGPEVLHFATHSVPNFQWEPPIPGWELFEFPQPLTVRHPSLRSFIALAGANRKENGSESGILTGLEVEGLHLVGTKLVVLSTCKAGQVLPVDGEGLVGLRTAFAIAGAEGVVSNLWKVNDEASLLFMKFFYDHFGDNVDPAEMVRMAQQEMIRETPYTHPYYWAGYQYSGTPAPPRVPSRDNSTKPAASPPPIASPDCSKVCSTACPSSS